MHEFKRHMALQRKEAIEQKNHKRRIFMLHRWEYLREFVSAPRAFNCPASVMRSSRKSTG